ncbi:hypothetical protein BO71DRAFT_406589 [Aspergillus ellipticus CBS 707.79]|uniref:Uncharacterized protein n=1 Tax=Aspergillus ellipticus CBS 707.79 TaxID=1448320 RepID=A0A319EAN7_9EURO|nr:hypothetical protein BO71DRAFT_406589 [Aspergillus ellipticus CBS 707.79]
MSTITPPPVTLEDLQAFQAKHFPGSVQHPTYQEQPLEEKEYYEEEDLGYYPDGVRRTLTDEQIRIFRHSEIHALLREKQLREEAEAEAEAEAREEMEQQRLVAAVRSEQTVAADPTTVTAAEVKTTTVAAVASSGGGIQAQSISQGPSGEDTAMDYGDGDVSVSGPSRSYENGASSRRPSQFAGRRIISYED